MFLLCVMIRRRPRSTRTDTRCTCPTRFQSNTGQRCERANGRRWIAPDYGETRVGMAVPDLRKAAPRETFHSLHIGAVIHLSGKNESRSLSAPRHLQRCEIGGGFIILQINAVFERLYTRSSHCRRFPEKSAQLGRAHI